MNALLESQHTGNHVRDMFQAGCQILEQVAGLCAINDELDPALRKWGFEHCRFDPSDPTDWRKQVECGVKRFLSDAGMARIA